MDITIEPSHIVEISTAPSPKKLTVPLIGLERFPTQQEIEGQDARNRRPVRPIDRQRMRPWLMELLDMGNVFGLRWTSRHQGIFQISWRHASRLGWNLETDGDVFERWARHTGIYKEGDPPEPKRWKANFRCALHSLTDVLELTNAVERRGRNACRTYQFLQNSMSANPKIKTKKQSEITTKAEVSVQRNILPLITYEPPPPPPEPEPVDLLLESASSDELLSETESEGSQRDKVIVQRVEAKSQDGGEDYLLHHDHDYSAGPVKSQKTIYLRQGVGSIVLQKEIHSAPEDGEGKSYMLSNLDQLASAAVSSENIIVQRSPVSGLLDSATNFVTPSRISPTKAVFDLSFTDSTDKTEYSLKSLLPRLRARIKESEKAGGLIRKRKGSNIEIDFDDAEPLENRVKVKREKSEKDSQSLSPPSPPVTRRRSGSPKKAVKVVTKSKRSRKESEESASDSTEPLMSSCLLLLEAATRLDNAEKNGSPSNRPSSKSNKRGTPQSMNASGDGRRRASGRILRSDKTIEEQVVIEGEVNHENIEGETYEIVIQDGDIVSQEIVIEEEVYHEDAVQIIYETEQEQPEIIQTEEIENSPDVSHYHDILRTTLENIGSELEVSTMETTTVNSSPKEMAIMRRKKDPERTPASSILDSISGATDTTSPKGLFSGSEIMTDDPQPLSIVRKRVKGKNKSSPKDNIYFVDIRANGGSICVKQSDDVESEEKEIVTSPSTNSLIKNAFGIPQTVIKRELPVLTAPSSQKSPQNVSSANLLQNQNNSVINSKVFISQNSAGQQIIFPMTSGVEADMNSNVAQTDIEADTVKVKQVVGQKNQGGSIITLGSHGKALVCKSDPAGKLPQKTTVIPLISPGASLSSATNVKISTLPIVSSVKPSANISVTAAAEKATDKALFSTANSIVPIKIIPKVSTSSGGAAGTTQLAAISSGGKTWILQPRGSAARIQTQISKPTAGRMLSPTVITKGQPITNAISTVRKESEDNVILSSTANIHPSISGLSTTAGAPLMMTVSSSDGSLPAQADDALPDIAQSPVSQTNTGITQACEQTVLSSPSCTLSSDLLTDTSNTSTAVPFKTEICVSESEDLSAKNDLQNIPIVISQASSNSSAMPENFIKEEMALEHVENSENSEIIIHSSSDLVAQQLAARLAEGTDAQGTTYHIIEGIPDASSGVAVDIIVKTEEDAQQILSSGGEVQGDQIIIHTTETVTDEGVSATIDMNDLSKLSMLSGIEVASVESTQNAPQDEVGSQEEIISQHHHREPLSMDPRTPLAIGEIPLFAASKGDSDYMGSD